MFGCSKEPSCGCIACQTLSPGSKWGHTKCQKYLLGHEKSVDFCGPFSDSFQMAMDYIPDAQKISVFSVTQLYLNLLVKPRIFSGFLKKKYNFMHFEMGNAFHNA